MFWWILWGVLLIVQNASFTLVSRARNSNSLFYHAWASVFSNGVWIASQFILVDKFIDILKEANWTLGILTAVFYVACTMAGSLGMHWLALNKIEKRNG